MKREGEMRRLECFMNDVFVCRDCYEKHVIKLKDGYKFRAVCKKCNSTILHIMEQGKKSGLFCRQCQKERTVDEITIAEKPRVKYPLTQTHIFEFSEVIKVINGMTSHISLFYLEPHVAETKLFISKEKHRDKFSPIETKESHKTILQNQIKFKIDLSNPHNFTTSWNKSKTNFDIHDEFEKGYSLTIAFSEPNNELMKHVMQIIRNIGFGIMPGKRWIHCHFHEKTPSNENALKLLEEVTIAVTNDLQKFVKQL